MSPDDLTRTIAVALAPFDAVRVAWVFGSRITGRARPDSDLDVAVAYGRGLDATGREHARRAVVAALTDALGAIGERTDVVDVAQADAGVAFRALVEGRRVVARTEAERVATEVRVARRYDDDAPRRALFRIAAGRTGAP